MKVKILERTETTDFRPGFKVVPVYETSFMVGEYGPFKVSIDKARWTKEEEKKQIEAQAKAIKEASEPFEV